MRMKSLACLGMLVATVSVVQADVLNYDPLLPAPAPVLDSGVWTYDDISAAWSDSTDSPYVYVSLPGWATFTLTDDFIVGDQYKVWDGGNLILTTALSAGGVPIPGAGGPGYQWGQVLLAPGAHSLTVQGDGVAGVPAGFFTHLDSAQTPGMPDGGSLMLVTGMLWGALGLGSLRRKRA
jgi:hypothetical protein